MPNETKRIFQFDEFRLDIAERLLWSENGPVSVTPKVFDLLALMVENPGRLLEKDWILRSLWPDAFVEEANLTVNMSSLRKALGPAGSALIETVPKKGYRFTGIVSEITVATVPKSLPSRSEEPPESTRKEAGRERRFWGRWPILFAATAIIAMVGYVLSMRSRNIQKLSDVRSMAVLPFRPLVKDTDQDYLSLGMADALIGKLSMIQRIMVRSTAAVQKYTAASDPIAAGRDLRVDVVLDGSVQRDGKMIRVSVQMLRVNDGTPLWAERFDDNFTNIFQVQDSISEKVAAALSMKLTEGEHKQMVKRQTGNMEAYQLYLKAKYLAYKRSSDAMPDAVIDLYQQAIAKDPDYALAYAGLSAALMELATMEGHLDAIEQARTAALKAVGLDDSAAETHLAAGGVLFRGDWNWTAAQREFDRALAIDPHSASAHWSKSILLMSLGQAEQSLSEMQTAQRLDPSSPSMQDDLAWVLYCNRRWLEAIQASKAAVAMAPTSFAAHHQLGKAYLHAGEYDKAKAEFETTLRMHQYKRGLADIGQVLALTGDIQGARAVLGGLNEADRTSRTYESAYMHAVLYAALGDKDAAFRSLEDACNQKLSRAIWVKVDPDLDRLRPDPRFNGLLSRIRLSP